MIFALCWKIEARVDRNNRNAGKGYIVAKHNIPLAEQRQTGRMLIKHTKAPSDHIIAQQKKSWNASNS